MLNTIDEILSDLKQGKMIILMDDEDRENEGDLIIPAQKVDAKIINFMATYARGLICLSLSLEHCEKLNLKPMVKDNNSQFSTNFTVSIEAASGVTTGISAADRAQTIKAATQKGATAKDIVQPGHIFPLMAKPGGVLARAGHTEAACDLAHLAGFDTSAVIVEILNKDGTMARRADLEIFAKEHNLKIGTIASLIEYRYKNQTTIKQIQNQEITTEFGVFQLFAYQDLITKKIHFALKKGQITKEKSTFVRVQIQNKLKDLFCMTEENKKTWTLKTSMKKIAKNDGVIVLLAPNCDDFELLKSINNKNKKEQDYSRNIGTGSQILASLGVGKINLLGANKVYHDLFGFDLEIVNYINP